MARAFVIRPFNVKKDSEGNEVNFEKVHTELIKPALAAAGLTGGTTGQIVEPGNIREDMFKLILEADLVVADVTVHNANVFYELGIRHALRKKRTVMIHGEGLKDDTPFDLLTDRYQPYDPQDPGATVESLTRMVQDAMSSDRDTDSPVFAMMEGLPEADPARVTGAPSDFNDEVDRAKAAQAPGWLALLAKEVRGQRFELPGLKIVADAQWRLKDWEGALGNWQDVLENDPDDIDANLALANIYERRFREDRLLVTLKQSDQAIERVLSQEGLSAKVRAEAEALRARNLKSRWRQQVEAEEDPTKRREVAMDRDLIGAYEAYRSAYFQDLNAFYPGLTALQMGTILRELREAPNWDDAFDSDEEADRYKSRLVREVAALDHLVPAAVEAHLKRVTSRDVWAEISKADVQFLVSDRNRRVIQSYEKAIPLDEPFAWDAARGQLDLFRRLGIKAELAAEVIETIDGLVAGHRAKNPQAPESKDKLVYLLVMGGHTVDTAGREPRFPAAAEAKARTLLQTKLEALREEKQATHAIHVLASGAPGADILAHEICKELGIATTMCLPMPPKAYAKEVFGDQDDWRARFITLVKEAPQPVRQLSDRPGLPRWLKSTHADPWDRGNRWVMSMAASWNADRTGLLVLWDKKDGGKGGTAQMVELAREAGTMDVMTVDSDPLTAP